MLEGKILYRQNITQMKNIYILTTILLFSTCGISQSYHPVIKKNKYWDQCYTVVGGCYTSAARYEFIDGETYIDGVAYRNSNYYLFLGTPGPYASLCPPYSISNDPNVFAKMREDTLAKKVFIYDYNSTPKDQLLYDFTLNVGDTLQSTYAGEGTILVLYSIETVSLANGESRRKFCFDDQCHTYYIEEIGGPNGLFLPIIPMYGQISPVLLCVQDSSQILWGNNCDTYFVTIENANNQPLTIFLDPFHDRITITIKTMDLPANLEIIDLQGKIVVDQKLYDKKSEISVSDLIPGMYYYRINSDKSTNRGKLIKN